uniref:Alpha-methylacyl-CoA racemase n=2 Tax=Clastoptera arizonana TaxID=38151 RepID=A0A1B6C2W6_9HEMI
MKIMALRGIKVLEIAGLAPAPFCGMILADYGATVIKIDKTLPDIFGETDCLANGKKSVSIDLKHPDGVGILRKMCKKSDVLIEPFRSGVMEKLGLGPNILLEDNDRLIYARLTGYGQSGLFSKRAGHDINYVAMSGILSLLGEKNSAPTPPANLIADLGGGGLMCAFGIMAALFDRERSGKGQVIDCNMVEGSAYLCSWLARSQHLPIWGKAKGNNMLDGGLHNYKTYETKDKKWMAVGSIEHKFYLELLKGLNFTEEDLPYFSDDPEKCQRMVATKFKEKTQKEWCEIFNDTDACVTPVLSLEEAAEHPHNAERKSFIKSFQGNVAPKPAPRLSRTCAVSLADQPSPVVGQDTLEELLNLDYTHTEINKLVESGVVKCVNKSKL